MLNHDKGLFTITSGSMTVFFFLKKEEVSSSLLHCVACGCSMKLNIFMVILEREKKNLVGRCIIQKMKGFQGMVEQSRNDELISSALVIGPE